MERTSMLVIRTPDGRLHGQRLTDHEAAELGRRLLELRGEPVPKHRRTRRHGGGRKKVTLAGMELKEVVRMWVKGMSYDAIGRATHHGVDVIRRSLEAAGCVQADVQGE